MKRRLVPIAAVMLTYAGPATAQTEYAKGERIEIRHNGEWVPVEVISYDMFLLGHHYWFVRHLDKPLNSSVKFEETRKLAAAKPPVDRAGTAKPSSEDPDERELAALQREVAAAEARLARLKAADATRGKDGGGGGGLCVPGAAVDIHYVESASWVSGKVKKGPDAQRRCYVSWDGYGPNSDEWVTPERLRAAGEGGNGAVRAQHKVGDRVEILVGSSWQPATLKSYSVARTYVNYSTARDDGMPTGSSVGSDKIRAMRAEPAKSAKAGPADAPLGKYAVRQFNGLRGNYQYPLTLLSRNSYKVWDKTGSYQYDAGSKRLRFTSGPLNGFHGLYHTQGPNADGPTIALSPEGPVDLADRTRGKYQYATPTRD